MITEFIKSGWEECIRYNPQDDGTLIGMPYPYTDDAKRAAKKYIDVSEKMYEKTGVMWEKYNVLTGDSNTAADYKSREMLGWSAGVYLYAKQYAERKQ